MANSGWLTITGKGRSAISPSGYIKEILLAISVTGQAIYESPSNPKRTWKAGWVALGYHNVTMSTVTAESVMWWMFITMNMHDIILPASTVYGDSLWYQLNTGVTVLAEVVW